MIKIERKIWGPVVIWLSLFLFIFNIANYFQPAKFALINASYETLSNLAIFYITYLFLFPRYYPLGKQYFWVSLLFLMGSTVMLVLIDDLFIVDYRGGKDEQENPPKIFHFLRYFFSTGFTFFVATSVRLMEHTTRLKEAGKVLVEEKLQTELKLLKAQINPHFIFNALNNIYSLTYMQSKNAPESVLKLSDMLRYVFYDCSRDRVKLSAELNYIENFTAFQQMKSEFEQNISLKTNVSEGADIAPMLFIPFVENAFKYSRIEESEEASVHIEMEQQKEKIYFCIENTVPGNKPNSGSGMGIKNVQHRLDIIYPKKYELKLTDEKHLYKAELWLEIDSDSGEKIKVLK